jgi:hypothetical protein
MEITKKREAKTKEVAPKQPKKTTPPTEKKISLKDIEKELGRENQKTTASKYLTDDVNAELNDLIATD